MLKKLLLSPWTALLTLALVVGIRIADPTFVESVRLRYFDTLVIQPRTVPAPDNIVVVNIDEAALDKYGQWPLPRANYAKIIEDLYSRNAGIVVLNVLMADRDRTGGDMALGAALKRRRVRRPLPGPDGRRQGEGVRRPRRRGGHLASFGQRAQRRAQRPRQTFPLHGGCADASEPRTQCIRSHRRRSQLQPGSGRSSARM